MMLSFERYLDAAMQHQGDAAVKAYQRLERVYQQGLDAKIEVAKERFHLFLQGTKTHIKGVFRDGAPTPRALDDFSGRFIRATTRRVLATHCSTISHRKIRSFYPNNAH